MPSSAPGSRSPVRLRAVPGAGQPDVTPALEDLYRGFEKELLVPLWTQIGELVPVGRGGERRAIALANPGLEGRAFATPTLWAAIQYLMPGENAPEHRHT